MLPLKVGSLMSFRACDSPYGCFSLLATNHQVEYCPAVRAGRASRPLRRLWSRRSTTLYKVGHLLVLELIVHLNMLSQQFLKALPYGFLMFFALHKDCTALALPGSQLHERDLLATPFFLFSNGPQPAQPENIKPRSNGQLLVTLNTVAELWQVDPFKTQTGNLVHSFAGYQSLFGIVESSNDIYHIIASNFTGAPDYYGFQGSVSIFEVNLRGYQDSRLTPNAVRVSKVLDIPQAQLLDGLALIDGRAGLLMSGDAQTGVVYLINTQSRTSVAVLQSELLNGTATSRASGLAHVGINGIKYRDSKLYWTNTAKGLYGIIPLDPSNGMPTGSPSVLEDYGTFLDDLSFDDTGNQYISEPLNGILLRTADSTSTKPQTSLLAKLYGANSNALGVTAADKCVLYSTYNGAPGGVARINVGLDGLCRKKL